MRMSRVMGAISGGRFDESCFTYTGTYTFEKNGSNWLLSLLTSGTLTLTKPAVSDLFLVGGGGAGGVNTTYESGYRNAAPGGGGGGGYTTTVKGTVLSVASYAVTIGAGGDANKLNENRNGKASKIVVGGTTYSAGGGMQGVSAFRSAGGTGGNGGSGGGGGMSGSPGQDGENGGKGETDRTHERTGGNGGTGQGTTTRAFCDDTGTLYGAGGYGGNGYTNETPAPSGGANSGKGGRGAHTKYNGTSEHKAGSGGSGIVLIRNKR